MVEEVSLNLTVAGVTQTKINKYNPSIVEVRADDHPGGGLSIRYDAVEGEVPTVNEKLLVAVLSGVHEAWLNNSPGSETAEITFEAISANLRALKEDHNCFDALHLNIVDKGVCHRLQVTMTDESGAQTRARVVLSKGQVVSMLAALLAMYDQLTEG